MRRFGGLACFLYISLSASLSQGAVLSWYWEDYGDSPGVYLKLSGIESGAEIVFNNLTFHNVHQVSYAPYGVYQGEGCFFSDDWIPPSCYDAFPSQLELFNAAREYDTYICLPEYMIDGMVLHSGPVETNDETNPGSLTLPTMPLDHMMTAGMGDLSMSFTVSGNINNIPFAHVLDPGLVFEWNLFPYIRTYVDIDITVNGQNYIWEHQPIGWMEPALSRLETDPADGNVDFGNVRIGTTAQRSARVYAPEGYWIDSHGYSCGGDFHQVDNNTCAYIPTNHGEDQNEFGGEWCCIPEDYVGEIYYSCVYFNCTGRGVGPVFEGEAEVDTTIDFGEVPPDSFFDVFFEISNVTGDEELGELTQLGFWAEIVGEDAALFEVVGDDTGVLLVGESVDLQLRFHGDDPSAILGEYDASLIIHTDIGAETGAVTLGESYVYGLAATAVPEPSTLVLLLGLSVMGFAALRR